MFGKYRIHLFITCLIVLSSLSRAQETIEDIIEHSTSICMQPEHKHYDRLTLAYVTPW